MSQVCVGCLDGNESIVKQGVSRFHALQSCTHVFCGQHVDKFPAVVENEPIGYEVVLFFEMKMIEEYGFMLKKFVAGLTFDSRDPFNLKSPLHGMLCLILGFSPIRSLWLFQFLNFKLAASK